MASLTTNTEENTTPETTTIVSYIKNLNKLRTILLTCPIQHFNNKISQKLTTHIHIHNNIKTKVKRR